jgi:hypothetical protein
MRIAWCGVLLLVAGCAGGTPASQPTVTATVTASATASASDLPLTTSPPPLTTSPPPLTTSTARVGVVPNVVGVNHQLAQDTMQAAGFYFLTEEDASGQGRLLLNDRNWVVVSQSPAGGTTAALDTKILLRSKKIGE